MHTYKEVVIEGISDDEAEILIALLNQLGFEGFEETDDSLKGYIIQEYFDEEQLKQLAAQYTFTYSVNTQKERNWNSIWESSFPPVKVNDFVAVRAAFHEPMPDVEHEIIITPKMSFGTGHHATTYMMVEHMRNTDFRDKSVFDFGTGTGILAILAEKLGAAKVYAVDNDDWSIENALENAKNNNADKIIIDKKFDALTPQKFDVILANINKNVLLENMHALAHQLHENGVIIMSGLLKEDEKDIVSAAKKHELKKQLTTGNLQWISIIFKKK